MENLESRLDRAEVISLYDVVVIPSEDGGFVGYIKGEEGIISQGKTKDDLIKNIRDALKCMTIFNYKKPHN